MISEGETRRPNNEGIDGVGKVIRAEEGGWDEAASRGLIVITCEMFQRRNSGTIMVPRQQDTSIADSTHRSFRRV
jgi:hypothetical protein